MDVETRSAALCVIRRDDTFLVAEIVDPHTGAVLHRPPGGGVEDGESPEQAVRRELLEEVGITLTHLRQLGSIDHTWFWKGREVRERAWIFLADSADYRRLSWGETLPLIEADGQRHRTLWRSLDDGDQALPSICPSNLPELLRQIF